QPNADVKGLNRVLRNFLREVDVAITPSKARAGDAHDCVVLAHQLQVLAQHRGISVEMTLPEFVAQHDNRLRLLTIDRIGRNQSPTQGRWNTHESETIGAEVDALHVFWQIFPGDGEAP